ncbi:MAG: ATP-dependent Clp protease ATP-binding subunit ClpA [Myxococcota bacterium]|nr:ATP-dependent Clp protease ATP-binding subunit ClpA [Myxococcota bacterium]
MANQQAQLAIRAAIRQAHEQRHEYVTAEHLLYALLLDPSALQIIRSCGGDPDEIRSELEAYLKREIPKLSEEKEDADPKQTLGFRRVLERAVVQVQASQREEVLPADVLVAIFGESESYAAYLLEAHGITRLKMIEYISHGIEETEGDILMPSGHVDDDDRQPKADALENVTVDLLALARDGKLDPLIGRGAEMHRILEVLCRRTRNNPLLIGDSGVGKTAVIHGLAQRVVAGDIPETIQGCELFMLDIGALLAGTKFRGQFEQRMRQCLTALVKKEKPILVIDEIHMIVGAGATSGTTVDVANLLKPALQTGDLRCIGATTHEDYTKRFEADKALARRFQKIEIPESSIADSVTILGGLKDRYEAFHSVRYTDDALESAAELSARHIFERFLPDKAIDVIDEAGARNQLKKPEERRNTLGKSEVEAVISAIANIPDLHADKSDRERLAGLEEAMKKVIFGQDAAIQALVSAIKLARAGLGHPDHPVGGFLFAGPTGVGKTEVARQLARALGIGFKRFDMSEYMEKHTVSRLIGAPPGYIGYDQGGLLTDAIRKMPHCVLLLDEIEKAHPDLFDILLQVMDSASLTDNNGRRADFHNVILIMTSNAGSREMSRQSIGFSGSIDASKGRKEVERLFSPEFRNRLTEIITFGTLDLETVEKIVYKFIGELQHQLADRSVSVTLAKEAVTWLAQKGYDDIFGARPLLRLIQKKIREPLAEEILFGKLVDGGTATVGLKDNEIVFDIRSKTSLA